MIDRQALVEVAVAAVDDDVDWIGREVEEQMVAARVLECHHRLVRQRHRRRTGRSAAGVRVDEFDREGEAGRQLPDALGHLPLLDSVPAHDGVYSSTVSSSTRRTGRSTVESMRTGVTR